MSPDVGRMHGTRAKYVAERCRCPECSRANTDYAVHREHAMNRLDETWEPYVDAAPAREHIEDLRRIGLGRRTIAELAGVAPSIVANIIYGRTGRPRAKRIRQSTEAKILAVWVGQARGGSVIPAKATWELLDDILARGYSRAWIAQRVTSPTAKALQIHHDRVIARTARRVEELHRSLGGWRRTA